MNDTARMARSITWASSKQSYLTARLLADRDLADDCLRAYAYFRWADDQIDIALADDAVRAAFIARQEGLAQRLYQGERPADLCPEEAMLADLIAHDRQPESGLRSFIQNFMAVIAFDAWRHGRTASRKELNAYTNCLAAAVMDGLQYFIGNGHAYPRTRARTLAVTGAHITHMLRDMYEDLAAGLVNIPAEDLASYDIYPSDGDSPQLRRWVRDQVDLARDCFRQGKTYIDSLDVLRCKLAGVWYCARFECVLGCIEREGCGLRREYPERHGLKVLLCMLRLGLATIWEHYAGRVRMMFTHPVAPVAVVRAENRK